MDNANTPHDYDAERGVPNISDHCNTALTNKAQFQLNTRPKSRLTKEQEDNIRNFIFSTFTRVPLSDKERQFFYE